MKITGIICEYNPFHMGHKRQIDYLKNECGTDFVVALMSGDFVQRGEPAILQKYARATDALRNGADMVFELPMRYALASAGDFAKGAMLCLASLSFVDSFCFGSENTDLPLMENVAKILSEQPPLFKEKLSSSLKAGNSYAKARELALQAVLNVDSTLFLPNSTLGIEYLKAKNDYNLNLTPIVIHRPTDSTNIKAHDIREQMRNDGDSFVDLEDFWEMFIYKLLATPTGKLTTIGDFNEEIASLFKNNQRSYSSMDAFLHGCKHKNYTMSRLKRCALQLIFEMPGTSGDLGSSGIPYLRLLGCTAQAKQFISKIESTRPIVRLNRDIQTLESFAMEEIEREIFASDLYRIIMMKKTKNADICHEFNRQLIVE